MTGARAIGRRRAIGIVASAAGLPALTGLGALAGPPHATMHRWDGTALGARASIVLHHRDRAIAGDLIRRAVAEIERLEAVFSLYRRESALSHLNRTGRLAAPPLDLVRLLSETGRYSRVTAGAFDVTVQPLWDLYASHFARPGADPAGPGRSRIEEALALIGSEQVALEPSLVVLPRPGMAITCNGIAQGYITDRVADLLRAAGLHHVLIDLGEARALAPRGDGRPWRIGIERPGAGGELVEVLELSEGAVASSAGWGTRFEPTGRHHHLFDPASGVSANSYAGVTVTAPTATAADALSTGFACMSRSALEAARPHLSGVTARFFAPTGEVEIWRA